MSDLVTILRVLTREGAEIGATVVQVNCDSQVARELMAQHGPALVQAALAGPSSRHRRIDQDQLTEAMNRTVEQAFRGVRELIEAGRL